MLLDGIDMIRQGLIISVSFTQIHIFGDFIWDCVEVVRRAHGISGKLEHPGCYWMVLE